MLMRGDVAGVLGELGRERWKVATRADLAPIDPCDDDWPTDLEPMFRDVDIAIARTRAAYDNLPEVREIETLYLDMIAAAKRFIYFENQYFTSGKIAAAIATRMAEDDPPEIVMVMPRTADGWLEQQAMDAARLQLVATIGKADRHNRFRVYIPVTKGGDRHLRPRQGVDPRRPAAARRLVEPQQSQPGARQRMRRDRRCRARRQSRQRGGDDRAALPPDRRASRMRARRGRGARSRKKGR